MLLPAHHVKAGDGVSGLPLSNVTINLQGHDLSCTTDADGYYLFDELTTANYTVTCHTTGYNVLENVNDEVLPANRW